MFKQAKKHFRLEECRRRNGKCNGLYRELVLACDPEFRGLIRSGRNKKAIVFAGDFNYERDLSYHYQHDRKSWKSRCKKRHQWEKHFHTAAEEENARLVDRECEERGANEVYEILKAHSEWVKFDIRNNVKWEYGIDFLLRKKRAERLEAEALKSDWVWSYPVRTIRAIPCASPDRFMELEDLATNFFFHHLYAQYYRISQRMDDAHRQILLDKGIRECADKIKVILHGEYRRNGKMIEYSDSRLRSLLWSTKGELPTRKRYGKHWKKIA